MKTFPSSNFFLTITQENFITSLNKETNKKTQLWHKLHAAKWFRKYGEIGTSHFLLISKMIAFTILFAISKQIELQE